MDALVPPNKRRYVQCPICDKVGRRSAHHLIPQRAEGRVRKLRGATNVIQICDDCHKAVHARFGPGNNYCGPTDRQEFIDTMRELWKDSRVRAALKWMQS